MFKRSIKKKIGELLIERDIISPQQLEVALRQQKQQGGYISQQLIALNYASEFDIALCLSNQYNFAYLPLSHYIITPDILKLIPLKWIMMYTMIPVDRIGDVLSVAMADPLNEGVIRMLEEMTNCELQVLISTYSEIKDAIKKYYGDELQTTKEVPPPDIGKLYIAEGDIQTRSYNGIERRRYLRVDVKLNLDYTHHGILSRAETINVSFAGVCFFAPTSLSVDTDLNCKLHLFEGQYIDCIVKVLRVQPRDVSRLHYAQFEVAGVFDFIGNEERTRLADLLKKHAQ